MIRSACRKKDFPSDAFKPSWSRTSPPGQMSVVIRLSLDRTRDLFVHVLKYEGRLSNLPAGYHFAVFLMELVSWCHNQQHMTARDMPKSSTRTYPYYINYTCKQSTSQSARHRALCSIFAVEPIAPSNSSSAGPSPSPLPTSTTLLTPYSAGGKY